VTKFFQPISSEQYQSFVFEDDIEEIDWHESYAPILQESFGKTLSSKLRPLRIIPNPQEHRKSRFADVSLLGAHSIIIFSFVAYEKLEHKLAPYGDFVPLKNADLPYIAFHVTNVISNAVIWEKSEYRETAVGGKILYKPTLDGCVVRDSYIFMLEESVTQIYLSEEFLADCKRYKLTGLKKCVIVEAEN
jgi:hypothetical protein